MKSRLERAAAMAAVLALPFACARSAGESARAPSAEATTTTPSTGTVQTDSARTASSVDSERPVLLDGRAGPQRLPHDPLPPVSSAPSLTPRTFGGGPPPDLPQPHDSIDHRTPTVGIEPVGGK
jgi:hypothetical protein